MSTASSGCAGRAVEDLPVEISADHKPFDQRDMIFSFTTGEKLPDRMPERAEFGRPLAAIEQAYPEFVLEDLHLLTDRRVRDAHYIGRGHERALFGNGDECFEAADGHG